jgi:hypothetical protein
MDKNFAHSTLNKRRTLASIPALTVSLWCLLLAACGGGGSDSTQPTTQELAAGKAATLNGAFDTSNGMATLSWTDTFANAGAYQIEEQQAGGTWSVVASVPGQQGSQKMLTWNGALAATASLRVEAMVPGLSIVLQTASGQQSVQIVVPPSSVAITLGQSQPIWGSVQVSIGGSGAYSPVNYYVDSQSFGSSSTGPGYGVTLDTSSLTTGSHPILAKLATSADAYIELHLTVNVAPPVATLPQQATLLAAEGATLLYQPLTGGPHLLSGTTDTILAPVPSTPNAPSRWILANGHVFADNQSNVYMWAADGSVTNLSMLSGEGTQGPGGLISVQWPWALWAGAPPTAAFVFYNVATAQELSIALPSGSIGINPPASFYLAQGQLSLYYSAATQGGAAYNIFTWSQSTGLSTAVTSGAGGQYSPQTDGQRVAWQTAVASPNLFGEPLITLDITSNTQQTLSNDEIQGFVLAGGLLAWFEITDSTSGNWDFKVSDGATTTTVLTGTGYSNPAGRGGGNALSVVGTSSGVVAFEANSMVYSWSSAHGLQVIYDFTPLKVLMSGTTLYAIPNSANTVYTTTLQ